MTSPELSSEAIRAVTNERLKILSYAYYIKGSMIALTVSIFIFHFIFLLAFSFIPQNVWDEPKIEVSTPSQTTDVSKNQAIQPAKEHSVAFNHNGPPVIIFRVMAGVIGLIILLGWTFGALTIYAGRCLQKRQKRTFIYVIAGINLIFMPYGTVISIFTFITLSQADAQEQFPS